MCLLCGVGGSVGHCVRWSWEQRPRETKTELEAVIKKETVSLVPVTRIPLSGPPTTKPVNQ